MTIATTRAELKLALDRGGIREALAFMNARTTHRFSAVYCFDDDMLRNIVMYDRENPDATEPSPTIPVGASYCVFVRDRGTSFSVTHAAHDRRVDGHEKQEALQAYCGVPLIDASGRMFGTICHFDFHPMKLSDDDVALMEAIAPFLAARPELHRR